MENDGNPKEGKHRFDPTRPKERKNKKERGKGEMGTNL